MAFNKCFKLVIVLGFLFESFSLLYAAYEDIYIKQEDPGQSCEYHYPENPSSSRIEFSAKELIERIYEQREITHSYLQKLHHQTSGQELAKTRLKMGAFIVLSQNIDKIFSDEHSSNHYWERAMLDLILDGDHREIRYGEVSRLKYFCTILTELNQVFYHASLGSSSGMGAHDYESIVKAYMVAYRKHEINEVQVTRLFNEKLADLVDSRTKNNEQNAKLFLKFFRQIFMSDLFLQPDRAVVNMAFKACSITSDSAFATFLIDNMSSFFHLRPNRISINETIKSCRNPGDLYYAWKILNEMEQRWGVSPDKFSINDTIRACSGHGDIGYARYLLEHMEDLWGVRPDKYSVTYAMNAAIASNDTDYVVYLLYNMKNNWGVEPDIFSYNTTLEAFSLRGEYHKAQDLLVEMKYQSIVPNSFSMNYTISAHINGGDYQGALRHAQTMNAYWGVQANAQTSKLLKRIKAELH